MIIEYSTLGRFSELVIFFHYIMNTIHLETRPLLMRRSNSRHLLLERQNVGQRTKRRDRQRVDLRVAAGVVPLDVLKLRRVAECRQVPVQVAHPRVDGGVAGTDVANVALEVLHVDGVEADERDVAVTYVSMSIPLVCPDPLRVFNGREKRTA